MFYILTGAQLKEFCQYGTREECSRLKETSEPCKRLHFRKIINKHTDGKYFVNGSDYQIISYWGSCCSAFRFICRIL